MKFNMKFKMFYLLLITNSLAMAWLPKCSKSDQKIMITYQDKSTEVPQSFLENYFSRLVPGISEDHTTETSYYNDIVLLYVITRLNQMS